LEQSAWKLNHDKVMSSFAFNLDVRRYIEEWRDVLVKHVLER